VSAKLFPFFGKSFNQTFIHNIRAKVWQFKNVSITFDKSTGRQAGHLLKSVRYALRLLTSVNDTRKNGQNKENKNIYFQQKFQSVNSF
jgi:RecA/RadA recombinase